jgi:acyl-coenzyme A thioesterase PaaI-like protein
MTQTNTDTDLHQLRSRTHRNCFVCSSSNVKGLHLAYELCDDGSVTSEFDGGEVYEGYLNMLHGGVIACLLDGAMTNCLFAHGICAATAELIIRYRKPVESNQPATVTARITRSHPPLHMVEASLAQEGDVKVVGTAKFLDIPADRN